jgi:hypothetical protein
LIASCLQQVLGSFIIFEITWPDTVLSFIEFLKNAGDFIQIDLLEIPGLACPWSSYSYETRFHVTMATPLVISVMLMMPLPVAWFLARREDEEKRNLHQNSQPVDLETTSAEVTGSGFGFGGGFASSSPIGASTGGFGASAGGFGAPAAGAALGSGFAFGATSAPAARANSAFAFGATAAQATQPAGSFGASTGGFGASTGEIGASSGGMFGAGNFGAASTGADHYINWRLRYEKTVNTFMNNIMCVHSCDLLVDLSFILTVKVCVCTYDKTSQVGYLALKVACMHMAGSGSSSSIQELLSTPYGISCAERLPIRLISLLTSQKCVCGVCVRARVCVPACVCERVCLLQTTRACACTQALACVFARTHMQMSLICFASGDSNISASVDSNPLCSDQVPV